MNFLQKITLISILLLSFGCENEVDINADYEEVTVVYSLLDQNSDTQFVKVNKTFLDDNISALDLAKDPSRLNYDSLKVSLIRAKTNTEYFLSPIERAKEPGTFTDEDNFIYYTDQKIAPNEVYDLKIEKPDGSITTGNTKTIDTVYVKKPFFNLAVAFVDRNSNISSYTFKFQTGYNIAEFEIEMYFKYTEVIGPDSFPKRVRIPLTRKYNPSLAVGVEFEFYFDGIRFFDAIETQVPAEINPTKKVILDRNSLDINIYAADEDYSFYRELNGPIEGLAQTRPEYTNITNGYGLFSSRFSMVYPSRINDDTRIYLVSTYKDTRNFSFP